MPTISDDADIELLAEESGEFFGYLKDGNYTDEKALALVIDNITIRNMTGTASDDNLILVVGTFDDVTINSVKVLLSPNVPELSTRRTFSGSIAKFYCPHKYLFVIFYTYQTGI